MRYVTCKVLDCPWYAPVLTIREAEEELLRHSREAHPALDPTLQLEAYRASLQEARAYRRRLSFTDEIDKALGKPRRGSGLRTVSERRVDSILGIAD